MNRTERSPLHWAQSMGIRRLTQWFPIALFAVCFVGNQMAVAADRPNILWITSEDNSPYLGCYGDPLAETPNLDRLASEGVRYRFAFANAPVCSTARTTLITGMYATSLGAQNHRSRVAIPIRFMLYPQVLRLAGYYCTNNSKTDYNLADRKDLWDESSSKAHYRNRDKGQPFFAVFNLTVSHESQVAPPKGDTKFRVSPDEVKLPPFHPDTPTIRRDWANYYDRVTLMDKQAGDLLSELEKLGLADDTIVFYYSDHGGALPRGKRNIHDSGTRVPLIVRFPQKWQSLSTTEPGEWSDELVSFVDLPATVMSLCNVPIPTNYEGVPFLGGQKVASRKHVFLYRGRMDERYDTVRAICDGEFRYVRNYSPHRPWGQHYSYPFRVLPSMRSWYEEFLAGRCDAVQAAYWQTKPAEELYNLADDPFEIHNLAGDPQYAAQQDKLRIALAEEILATRDAGFIPEGTMPQLAGVGTIYEYAQSQAYPLDRILKLANQASEGQESHLPKFIQALDDPHPVIRYWAATGCLILGERAAAAKDKLHERLHDKSRDVRVVAAEALGGLGGTDEALACLSEVLVNGEQYETLAAENSIDALLAAGRISLLQAQQLFRGRKYKEPADRIPQYVLELQ